MNMEALTLDELFEIFDSERRGKDAAWEEIVRRGGYSLPKFNSFSAYYQEELEEMWRASR